jgi:cysteine desulfuration protein SufE
VSRDNFLRNDGLIVTKLDELLEELTDCDPKERIELLLDYARSLPPLPERFEALRDPNHRVEECQSPVYLFAEKTDQGVDWYADIPMEAPTVRGFVSVLWEGTRGASVEDYEQLSYDVISKAGLKEILGMQRTHGLTGVLRRLKKLMAEAA